MSKRTEKGLTVKLPSDWLQMHNLKNGDYVVLTKHDSGVLVQTEKKYTEHLTSHEQ